MRAVLAASAAFLALLAVPSLLPRASAGLILDQSFVPSPGDLDTAVVLSGVSAHGNIAQTFTVGTTGILSRVDLLLEDSGIGGDVLFDIRSTINGVPVEDDTAVLAEAVIAQASLPEGYFGEMVSVDISSFGVWGEPGDVLAIALRADGDVYGNNTVAAWAGVQHNPYTSGAHYFRSPDYGFPEWTQMDVEPDMGFKTFVNPVPEPSSMVYWTSLGVLGLLLALRRKLKTRSGHT